MGYTDWLLLRLGLQGACLILFMYHATWTSLLYFIIFLGSLIILPKYLTGENWKRNDTEKPKKMKAILQELYPTPPEEETSNQVVQGVMSLVSYAPENTESLKNFQVVKENSNCLFAKKAKLWGSPDWNEKLKLEGNISRLVPMFLKFTILCSQERLDGFLLELPGFPFGKDIQAFGDALYKVLAILSDFDPAGFHCMDKSYVGKRGWVFEFNKITFFITTFAPFYPENHARYSHGAENCYIFFQPELSFAFKDLPPDTSETNWTEPKTVRDRIRIAFKEAGRRYTVPEDPSSPMALDMLRPINEGEGVYEWWKSEKF
ncbi:uncharacterized protein LOC128245674 [Mya arenaria]|uniref:uncharacterized protein LOC128245674 n=1 Tax=Mya arenaria TaxID=6604 RepID=UPI0022E0855E|nr:uncharacterized protein LOC128245674 [Mya arenaria]XP_052819852.1 uncharacterized protein LOC128245674 [Mya arenaria]